MKLDPQFYKDFSSGMISNVSQNLVPANAVRLCVNMDADQQIGALTSRLGTGIVGSQLVDNKTVLGVHHHNPAGGTAKLFAAINDSSNTNSDIWEVGGSISKADDTASLKCRFLTYLGQTLRLNGTDAYRAWTGAGWTAPSTGFNTSYMPTGHKYAEEFLSRVYLAGKTSEPNRVEYSDVPDSGTLTWNSPVDFIEFEAEDNGGNITGLSKVPGYLLVFKERSMHRWNFYNAFPEQLVDIGSPSNESIVKGHGLVAFFSASSEDTTGFYITNGSRPVPISHDRVRSIKKWVDAISSANYADVAGYGTDRVFAWSVGDLTVDGETYNNAVLRYNRILDQWSVRTYPTRFYNFTHYTVSNTTKIVGGDDDGNIIQLDKPATYTDYSGKKIFTEVATHWDKFDFNQMKTISDKAIVDCEKLENVTVELQSDTGHSVMAQGTGKRVLDTIKELVWRSKLRGHKFSVIVRGEVGGGQGVIHEIEIPDVDVALSY